MMTLRDVRNRKGVGIFLKAEISVAKIERKEKHFFSRQDEFSQGQRQNFLVIVLAHHDNQTLRRQASRKHSP